VLGEIDHHLAFAGLAVNRIELHPVGAGAYNGFAGSRMKIGGSGSVGQSVRVSGTRSAQDAFDERDGPIQHVEAINPERNRSAAVRAVSLPAEIETANKMQTSERTFTCLTS